MKFKLLNESINIENNGKYWIEETIKLNMGKEAEPAKNICYSGAINNLFQNIEEHDVDFILVGGNNKVLHGYVRVDGKPIHTNLNLKNVVHNGKVTYIKACHIKFNKGTDKEEIANRINEFINNPETTMVDIGDYAKDFIT